MFSSCSLWFSCLFGCFLVGRWVHGKGHWASICILSYMLMCSINNHKASDFVLGRRFCALIHDSSMIRMKSEHLSRLLIPLINTKNCPFNNGRCSEGAPADYQFHR
ncbi:hypothetical protein GQ55_3G474800 [Panicum hallii var. hallii]|uniref:Uncharacterized protein n=1 Tax=Panicum hallii var. hallii TaxID=1504633 RepID=A0A2T7EJE4_9POAL|nr:hypothetical protein GQ55_3G474800 [Panicum hallii var. hallii]